MSDIQEIYGPRCIAPLLKVEGFMIVSYSTSPLSVLTWQREPARMDSCSASG